MAIIDNGWSTPRFRFCIKVLEYDQFNATQTLKVVQGYTGYVGLSHGGHVDPNMPLYFNNVIVMRQTITSTPGGQSVHVAIADADHIIRGFYQPTYNERPDLIYTMRPEDLFITTGRSALQGEDIVDTRLGFAASPLKKSRRKNSAAPYYLTQVVRNYRDVNDLADPNGDYNTMMAEAKGAVQEGSVEADAFLRTIKNYSTNFAMTGAVTYGEMCSIFPELDHIATIMPAKQVTRNNTMGLENHAVGQTEYWNGASNETVWSSILSQSVPSLMIDLMLFRIAFTATNETLTGEYYVEVGDPGSMVEGLDLSPYIDVFKTRLVTEVLRGLSSNNQINFRVNMVVDIMGETRIAISIGGGPLIDYATPSYSDALFAPILASSQGQVESFTYDLQSLSSAIGLETIHNYGQPVPQMQQNALMQYQPQPQYTGVQNAQPVYSGL
jgi:hypothetical protein